jgi:hypothetical protein
MALPKNNSAQCPPGMKPYTEANNKPDADTLWCEPAAAGFPPVPPPPPPKRPGTR